MGRSRKPVAPAPICGFELSRSGELLAAVTPDGALPSWLAALPAAPAAPAAPASALQAAARAAGRAAKQCNPSISQAGEVPQPVLKRLPDHSIDPLQAISW